MVFVLVASSMVGGLALVLAQMNKNQLILQKKSDSWAEVENLSQRIRRTLYDGASCLRTIRKNAAGNRTTLNPGTTSVTLRHVKNKSGKNVVVVNGVYGNGLVRVSSLFLRDISVSGIAGEMNLRVTFERLGKAIEGYKKTVRTYPLRVRLNAANRPISCESNLSSAVAVATKNVCTKLGGTYNAPDSGFPLCIPPTAGKTCPPPAEPSAPPLLPIGFDASGNLLCGPPPLSSQTPNPTGFNCFLTALYKGDHGKTNQLFQRIDDDAVAENQGDTVDVERLERWKINDSCPAAPAPDPSAVTFYTCNLTIGGINMSHTLNVCPSGYANRFINPLGTINDGTSGSTTVQGAYAAFMQHYCCR